MDLKSITTWSLVSYLAVLLSCGEALHQFPCFGHHHGGWNQVESNEMGSQVGCSCGNHGDQNSPVGDTELNDLETEHFHRCLICEFFDDYQTLVFQFDIEPNGFPCVDQIFFNIGLTRSISINAVARGPPVVS